MKKQDRQNLILTLLRREPELTVTNIALQLGVSQVTIRKDLTQMETEGLLLRAYGKAILPKAAGGAVSCFIPPESLDDYKRKQLIGAMAARFVQDEDFLFLGPGYTCLEVAKNLRGKKRLTLMTVNISAAIELADQPEFKLCLAPGDFTKRNGTYYVTGTSVYQYFQEVYIDKLFLTVDGVSAERGYSVLDEATARVFQTLIKPGCQVFVCATSSKFGKNALAPLGPLNLATHIITDAPLPEEFRRLMEAEGIQVVLPE